MDEDTPRHRNPAPLGGVEPHAPLLTMPADGQLLYKIMAIENLLLSIGREYLHFNRVDSYLDLYDGEQLPQDRLGNAGAKFIKAPDFAAADYYDQSRARTYACCFSLENSDFIWHNYGNGSAKGKVCVVFDFAKLRATLNKTLQPGNAVLEYNGMPCRQIFSVNYGIIKYIAWDRHQANAAHLANPIDYTYLKDVKFCDEKELRVSLSAPGVGQFVLNDGSMIEFPVSLQAPFDFRAAFADGTIPQILCAPNCDAVFLRAELQTLGIAPAPGSGPLYS